jgi:NAD(P)H-hydrate epimerase
MERAATACVAELTARFRPVAYRIFCGQGNNGGDGLAIARLLHARQYTTEVWIARTREKGTPDFEQNLAALPRSIPVHYLDEDSELPGLVQGETVIDALLGSGLNREPEGLYARLIHHLNAHSYHTIAIDVPSGMYLGQPSGPTVVRAHATFTFQQTKLCFLVPENAAFTGELTVVDIGLAAHYPDNVASNMELTQKADLPVLKQRDRFAHKGNFGHALLVAGSPGKTGAAVLAAKACLRSGVGLLTCLTGSAQLPILQISEPHAMCISGFEEVDMDRITCMGIGPGLSTQPEAVARTEAALETGKPIVIDADALNIISRQPGLLNKIPAAAILTPHPKEFDRLFGTSNNTLERINKAITLSQQYPFVLVLKGAYTLVAYQGKGFFNTTGNPGMATGGSGDILTGMLTGLLAQGYPAPDAARLGIYLHGLAADLAVAAGETVETLLPEDTIHHLKNAFNALRH